MRKSITTPLAALAALVTLAACGDAIRSAPTARAAATPSSAPPAVTAAFTGPAPGATGVSTAAELGLQTSGAARTTVTMASASGASVAGELRADGTAWVPATQLAYRTTYTATLTAAGADGRTVTARTTFTTMAPAGRLTGAGVYLTDGETVGVAMPVVIDFGRAVPPAQRAAVQRRLFVRSDPPQSGGWRWFTDTEVHYRPETPWAAGTKLSVRAGIGGLDLGGGWYGEQDRTAAVTVGPAQRISVDNAAKKATVTRDGQVVRTIPVSLGKPSTPSSSGHLMVMERAYEAVFDSSTYGVPVDSPAGYRLKVYYDLRLTWGGEYIHAAPWSVDDQGVRNVSHGCVNMSTGNASWLFELAHRGDPVDIVGTEQHVQPGDGWTDWELSFDAYERVGPRPPHHRADELDRAF